MTGIVVLVIVASLSVALAQNNNQQFVNNCPLVNAEALVSSGIQTLNQREGSYQTYIRAFFPYSPNSVPATAGASPAVGSGYVGRVWSSGRLYSNDLYPFSQVYHGSKNVYSIPDAALQDLDSNTELHFVGSQMYRYRLQNNGPNGLSMEMQPGYPKQINTTLRGAPSKVDAALQVNPPIYFLMNDANDFRMPLIHTYTHTEKEGYYYTEVPALRATVPQHNPVKLAELLKEPNLATVQAGLNYQGNLWIMYKTTQGQHWMAKLHYNPPFDLKLLSKVAAVSKPNAPVGVMTCAV